jgi:phosphatidate cytidylyltransferase
MTPRARTSAPAGIEPKSLVGRIGTAIVYAVAVVGAMLLDEVWAASAPLATGVVFGAMSGFAAAEFYAMARREARLPNELFGIAAAAFMPIAAALWGSPGLSAVVTGLIAASLVWHTLIRRTQTADTAITVFGAVYTGFLLSYLVLILRTFDAGLYLALLVVVSVWVSDVFAYFFGSLLGRHRLAPDISPKKSWEGFFAGALGTVAVWVAASYYEPLGLTQAHAVLTGAGIAIAAVFGDLAESRFKREVGVKDSGTALPGHGGFLDRLDSLILVGLVAFWVLWWGGTR